MSVRTTSIVPVSNVLVSPDWLVKSTAFPPGSHWGQRCVRSSFALSSVVSGSAWPPFDEIRTRPEKTEGEKTMVPSGPHVAPRLRSSGARVIGDPPVTEIFLSSVRVTKPIHAPSGEKNGW